MEKEKRLLKSKTKKKIETNSEKELEKKEKFEDREDLKKLLVYMIIVNFGQSDNIIRLLKLNHSSAQFVKVGEGTATKQVKEILGIEDTRKEIVFSLLREDYVEDFKKELEAYFAINKKNRGVAFTVDLTSMVGVKLYKFFTQTVRG